MPCFVKILLGLGTKGEGGGLNMEHSNLLLCNHVEHAAPSSLEDIWHLAR